MGPTLKVGTKVCARVDVVHENGIFLDYHGQKGIVVVTELSWDETRPARPQDFAQPGDELEVVVMTVHNDGFSGSVKRVHPADDPWLDPALQKKQMISATVRAITPFGMFVNLSIGLVAKLTDDVNALPSELCQGSKVQVRVVQADDQSRKVTAEFVASI